MAALGTIRNKRRDTDLYHQFGPFRLYCRGGFPFLRFCKAMMSDSRLERFWAKKSALQRFPEAR